MYQGIGINSAMGPKRGGCLTGVCGYLSCITCCLGSYSIDIITDCIYELLDSGVVCVCDSLCEVR